MTLLPRLKPYRPRHDYGDHLRFAPFGAIGAMAGARARIVERMNQLRRDEDR